MKLILIGLKMNEDISVSLDLIVEKKSSPFFYLWELIREKIKTIENSKVLTRLAFIITFSDFEKYSNDLETLALNTSYVDNLAILLLTLFECFKYCSKEKKFSYPQSIIYFRNFIVLLEKLPWAGQLCEKLVNLNNEFLVILLKAEPLNARLAKAIPDSFLLDKLEEYFAFIENFNNLRENYIKLRLKGYKNTISYINNSNNFFPPIDLTTPPEDYTFCRIKPI